MPSNIKTQIVRDRLAQAVVRRGEPSRDRRRRRPIDGDLGKCEVDSFRPRGLWMDEPHDFGGVHEQARRL